MRGGGGGVIIVLLETWLPLGVLLRLQNKMDQYFRVQ